jgi:hypothetical protein
LHRQAGSESSFPRCKDSDKRRETERKRRREKNDTRDIETLREMDSD